MTSPKEILEKLTACDFDALIGLFESEWLDAKETPYHLDVAPQKRELAKDVTALANAGGGIIVLGFECEKLPTTAGERIKEVCRFPISRVDPKRYNQILADLVHPPPHGVTVLVFENSAKDGNGVAAIVIDKAVMTEKPYLVGKMVDENDISIGSYFGYFERKRDFIPPISIARIQQQLSAGLQWASINERLSAMETKIDALTPSRKAPSKIVTILRPERETRIKKARITVGRDDAPLIYFDAAAESPCTFPTLFKSQSERVVRLIENPPQFRQNGFEIWADRISAIVDGRLRRNMIAGHRLIELWEDGEFIFIGPGDEDFLGWSVGSTGTRPIHISNFVLAEATLHFCWLMRSIFEEAEPKPSVLRLSLGLANLARSGMATLSDVPEGRMRGMEQPHPAPSPDREFYELAEWDTYDPARLAYLLLKNVYVWFGFNSDRMPYVDNNGPEPTLDVAKLIEKPLPTDPPATPGYY
jgi:hypothetical protein